MVMQYDTLTTSKGERTMTIKSLIKRIRHETRNGLGHYLYNKSRIYRRIWGYLYDRRLAKALAQYGRAYNKAISMCPSGIVSWALDDVAGLVSFNPHPDDVLTATSFLNEHIEMAIDSGDYNRDMSNTWDPSVFKTS